VFFVCQEFERMLKQILDGARRPPGGGRAVLLVAAMVGALLQGCVRHRAEADSSDEAFVEGWNYYRLTEFNLAQKYFEVSMKLATNETQRIRALSSLADVWNYRSPGQDRDKAAEIYRQVIEQDAAKAWAPWAALALARQTLWKAIDQFPDLAVMEEAYGGIMRDYPGTQAAEEAFLYLQTVRIAQLDDTVLDKAVAELEEWVVANPDSKLLSRAYGMLGHAYHLRREGVKYIAALAKSAEIEKIQGQNENVPQQDQSEAYFKMGTAAQFDAGDFEMARKYYGMLIEETPTDQRVFIAEQHMAEMDKYEASVREELKRAMANGEEK